MKISTTATMIAVPVAVTIKMMAMARKILLSITTIPIIISIIQIKIK